MRATRQKNQLVQDSFVVFCLHPVHDAEQPIVDFLQVAIHCVQHGFAAPAGFHCLPAAIRGVFPLLVLGIVAKLAALASQRDRASVGVASGASTGLLLASLAGVTTVS